MLEIELNLCPNKYCRSDDLEVVTEQAASEDTPGICYVVCLSCGQQGPVESQEDEAKLSWNESYLSGLYPMTAFEDEVYNWMENTFNRETINSKQERNFRFTEESLELVQSLGMSKEEVLTLVEYVYSRPIGEKHQELGGTMVTLAALAKVNDMSVWNEARSELSRCWHNIEKIKSKQAGKPKAVVGTHYVE